MATSGTTTWQSNRNEAISAALRRLGVLPSGGTASTSQISDATYALNSMLKSFHADGMPLWAINEYTFPTVAGTNTYNIGEGQTLNTPMPLKVIQAYRIEQSGAVNVPMLVHTHYNYNLLPLNAAQAEPINLYYQPLSTYGVIKLWPTPIDATTTVTIVYQRPFEDMTASTNNFDFPAYWNDAIVAGLAWRLSGEYGIPIQDRQLLQKEAMYFHDMAMSFGTEEGSLFLMPDWAGRK